MVKLTNQFKEGAVLGKNKLLNTWFLEFNSFSERTPFYGRMKQNHYLRYAASTPSTRSRDPLEFIFELCHIRLVANVFVGNGISGPTSPPVDTAAIGRRE